MGNLNYLLKPKSIAIVGVTDKKGTYGWRAATYIPTSEIGDHVYYVHPSRSVLFGRKVYPNLSALPEVVECVVCCVNKKLVPGVLEEAGSLGTKAAVVYASGFNEEHTEEGIALEKELIAVAKKYDMEVCGPNTAGIVNKIDNVCLTVGDAKFKEKPIQAGIGLVGQSGFIVGNLNQMLGDNLAYAVGSGNGSVTYLEDYLHYYVEDEHVNCIGVYLEGIKDAGRFAEALCAAAKKRKPVVILKSGKSKKGAAAAASHTGNLAGSTQACESVFEKFGVISVDSLEEFVSMCKMFSVLGENLPKNDKIAAINFSGGENTLCADQAERVGIEFAAYDKETMAKIKELLPSFASVNNPLDATTDMFRDTEKFKKLLLLLEEVPEVGAITIGSELNEVLEAKDVTITSVIEELKNSEKGYKKPIFLIPSFERQRNVEARLRMLELGVPLLTTGEVGYKSLFRLCRFVKYDPEKVTLELAYAGTTGGKKEALSEYDSKRLLEKAGVRIPKQKVVKQISELETALEEIPFPVAMKIHSPDIMHKTEAGGVKLQITSLEEAKKAYNDILESCCVYKPDARIQGILVQEMVPAGMEMIIGVMNDAQFGQMLLVGMGGIFVEVFKDAALYPCPVNHAEAKKMIQSLKAYKMLTGYRGSTPCDIEALADMMVKISQYAAETKETLAELDLNPVFVYEEGKGVCAADALIVNYVTP